MQVLRRVAVVLGVLVPGKPGFLDLGQPWTRTAKLPVQATSGPRSAVISSSILGCRTNWYSSGVTAARVLSSQMRTSSPGALAEQDQAPVERLIRERELTLPSR